MAKDQEQEKVTVEYIGSGGPASGVADYREDGSGIVEKGDTLELPKDVAATFVLNSDWVYAGDAPEDAPQDNREDPNVGESPLAGLTANDETTDKPYSQVVREREEEFGVNAPNRSDEPSVLEQRFQQIRDAEAETEEGAGDGSSSDEEQEDN